VWFLALLSFVLSVVLLGLSIFPGPLEQVPVTTSRYVGGVYMLFAAVVALRRLLGPTQPGKVRQRGSAVIVLLCLLITPLLLYTDTPRRLVFLQHQADFETLLEGAPSPGNHAVVPLNADLSVFWIDQWGTDARGGTYFRTMSGRADGKAERRSFGFAYKPNAAGSPFGDGRYALWHLTGDWYSFSATDDR
jgi:hypothetical protein